MKRSAPNTWRYGGILERVRWDPPEPGTVRMWDGSTHEVHPGDVVLLLHTGSPAVVFAGVEHRGGCAA